MGSDGHGQDHGGLSSRWGALVIAVAVLAYGVGWMTRPPMEVWDEKAEAAPPGYTEPLPAHGPPDAEVVIHEVVDYKCGFCAIKNGFLKRLRTEHHDVRFVVKHFPFLQVGQSLRRGPRGDSGARAKYGSLDGAIAAMAANRQGRFWDYSDQLYLDQRADWTAERLEEYAKRIGLDVEKFKADMLDPNLCSYVRKDGLAARQLRVLATPTLYVNGRRVGRNATSADVRRLIREARNSVHRLLRTGAANTIQEARALDASQNHPGGATFGTLFMNNDGQQLQPKLARCFHSRAEKPQANP